MNLQNLKLTALVNAFSFFKIPLLAATLPRIVVLDESQTVVRIRLGWRTRNHLSVMYFGALAMGAELSVATKAIQTISESGKRVDFIFKDFHADFLKRADGHVHFICKDGKKIAALVKRAIKDGERHHATFTGQAIVPAKSKEPVMKYKLTLSVKAR